jgi:hypothetical protein
MRQWSLMFLKPNPIAQVDTAAEERAFPEVVGLGQWRSADLFARAAPARPRLVHWHDRCSCAALKKIRPRFSEARSYGARHTSGRAAIVVHIVMVIGAVKLLSARPQDSPARAVLAANKARHRIQRRR